METKEKIVQSPVKRKEDDLKILMKKYKHKNSKMDKIFIVSMLSIFIIQFLVFWVYTNIQTIVLAFQDTKGNWTLETFQHVFQDFKGGLGDPLGGSLAESLKNTLLFWSSGIVMIPLNLFVSYLLYKKIRFYRLWQVALFLPGIIGSVVMITAFKAFMRPDYGIIGVILRENFGVKQYVLTNPETAIWVILFYSLWMGWASNMMLFGGAMARIPIEVLESARIDGVGAMREFTQMILPLIWPTLSTVLILSLTSIITANGGILLFTGGGAGTYTISYWLFDMSRKGTWGYNLVSAAGLLFTSVTVPLILLARWLIEKLPTVDY